MVYYIPVNNSYRTSENKPPFTVFLAATVVIFFLSLSTADSVGFVPDYIDGSSPAGESVAESEDVALSSLPQLNGDMPPAVSGVAPERIEIPVIDMDLPVQNIESKDIQVLYENLKNGPIRYVDSARLGEDGNVLIFGHSSRLPVVRNQMYKAFNKISELKEGDTISVSGGGHVYLYRVVSVEQKDIKDPTAVIDLGKEGKRLTLVTCDTLTGETARFVLTATYVGTI